MKTISKVLFLLMGILALNGCSENLEDDKIPAIQTALNGEFFGLEQFVAVRNNDGTVTIQGIKGTEIVTFDLAGEQSGVYLLGPGADSSVSYVNNPLDLGGNVYSTSFGNGRGRVDVFPTDALNTISAEFSLVSYLANGTDSLYMRQGIIFKVPFGDPVIDIPGGGGTDMDAFAAKVNGLDLVVESIVVNYDEMSGFIQITGGEVGTSTITIAVSDDLAVGTYDIPNIMPVVSAFYSNNNAPDLAIMGSLEITSHDMMGQVIEGTFSFVTPPPNDFMITEGSFSISY